MSDDIVARLRLYANASIDGGWASVFRADLNIACDEIERMRNELQECNKLLDEYQRADADRIRWENSND